jgi:FMN-dependent NADH-azoreductase
MSKKILYITANPKLEKDSFSLQVGRAFIERYKNLNPEDEVVELDLFKTDVPHLNATVFEAFGKLQNGASFEDLNADEQALMGNLDQLLNQFIAADKYLFVSPMWNFSVPPVLKAYIDVVMQAGKTFHYTENGPEGLMKNKKAIHIQASGGIYTNGGASEMEFGYRYLKSVLGFMGVTDVDLIPVEGVAMQQNSTDEIIDKASSKAKEIAIKF